MKLAQPLGQKMDQAGAPFRRAVESGEKAMQVLQKAQENFEQVQQEVMQAHTDLEMLMQEAPLQVMPVPPGEILGSFDRNHRKSVEPGCRTTTRQLGPRNPGVEADPPDPFGYPVPGGWCSLGCRVGRRTGSRGDGGLRGGTCSRRAAGRSNGEHTDNTTAEAGQCPVLAGPKVANSSHAESQRHGFFALSQRACAIIPDWQVPEILHRVSVYCCVGMLQHAPWETLPACFDQTCGYPGEGPLTTLDSPDTPGMCLTPTQEIRTCDMVRRKTKEKRGERKVCRACETPAHSERMVSSAGNVMCGHATQHVAGLLRLCIVVGCQALLRMSPRAKAAPRCSAAAQPKEHLDCCKAWSR